MVVAHRDCIGCYLRTKCASAAHYRGHAHRVFRYLFLWLYPYLPKEVVKISHFIGRNSLILLLFSPMFTVLSKLFQSYLLFEPSGMLFMLVALLFTVVCSFTVAYTLQKLHIAQYMFGKSRIIK